MSSFLLYLVTSLCEKNHVFFASLIMVGLISGCTNLAPPAVDNNNWIDQRGQLQAVSYTHLTLPTICSV